MSKLDMTLDYDNHNAITNEFVNITRQACKALGTQLQTFGIYNKDVTVDFAKFDSIETQGKKLVDEVAEYIGTFLNLDIDNITNKKALFFDYLASIAVCYVEVPKYVTKNGKPQHTYDKFLCTKNPKIITSYLQEVKGITLEDVQKTYTKYILPSDNDDFWCVKINLTGKNPTSKPRKAYDASKMRILPLYMIESYIEGLKTVLENNIIEFTYKKDNGTERVLNSTLSRRIYESYYDDQIFVNETFNMIDLKSKLTRGYIRIPEVGASIYDTGTRSLNMMRITKIRSVKEVDRTFIKVDINGVLWNFDNQIDYVLKNYPEDLKDIYETLTKEKLDMELSPMTLAEKLKTWAEARDIMLSTTFRRELHLFLIDNQMWFPTYTGEKKETGLEPPRGVYL